MAPELNHKKVLKDDGTLEERKRDITLRMLLSHTSGFAYEFFNPKLREYGRPVGYDCFHADIRDILRMPLVHQPGEAWEYGTGIDWAGIVLERATGIRLNDWIQSNIMLPLDLKAINMFPTKEMKKNLAYMHQRWPSDPTKKSEERDHIYRYDTHVQRSTRDPSELSIAVPLFALLRLRYALTSLLLQRTSRC